MKLTEEVKKEIREALEAATPGPWIYINENWGGEVITEDTRCNVHNCENWICQFWFKDEEPMMNHKKNAHLIANAPTWLKAQQDYIDFITGELALYKRKIEELEKENTRLSNENDQNAKMLLFADQRINRLRGEERQNVNS